MGKEIIKWHQQQLQPLETAKVPCQVLQDYNQGDVSLLSSSKHGMRFDTDTGYFCRLNNLTNFPTRYFKLDLTW